MSGLVGEGAADLAGVVEVVGGPGGEELGEGDLAEGGVGAVEGELVGGELHGPEGLKVGGAESGELVEEVVERAAAARVDGGVVGEGVEGARGPVLKDDAGAGDPVLTLADDEVADDLVGRPGAVAVVGVGEVGVEAGEEGAEGRRGALEGGEGVWE